MVPKLIYHVEENKLLKFSETAPKYQFSRLFVAVIWDPMQRIDTSE